MFLSTATCTLDYRINRGGGWWGGGVLKIGGSKAKNYTIKDETKSEKLISGGWGGRLFGSPE